MWTQAGLSFLVWVGYGVWLRGRSMSLRNRIYAWSRGLRVLFASVGFFVSLALLFWGLKLASDFGVDHGRLTPGGWLLITVTGVVFVHGQVLAAGSLVSLVVRDRVYSPAETSDSERG